MIDLLTSSPMLLHAQVEVCTYRWDSSVAGSSGHPILGDEELVAGLRKSKYSSLQSGWLPATPDHALASKVCSLPQIPSAQLYWSVGFVTSIQSTCTSGLTDTYLSSRMWKHRMGRCLA